MRWLAGLFGLLAALQVGCYSPLPRLATPAFGLDFRLPEGARCDGVIFFMIDGVNATTFQDMLEAGELPNIQRFIVERGLYVPRAACSHPSLTMNNQVSLMSGRYSGRHGIVAAKWFDRNRLLFRNYETLVDKNRLDEDHASETLYSLFPDRLTFSLFLQAHRGATYFYENRLTAGAAVFIAQHNLVDRLAIQRFEQVTALARQYRQFPAVCTVYQLAVNFNAYDEGASSPAYRRALRDQDDRIGHVLSDLNEAGLLDKVVVALVSDHGHCDTPRHGPINAFVESLGVSLAEAAPCNEDTSFEERLRRFGNVAGVPYGGGDRYWAVYLRKPLAAGPPPVLADWLERPTPEELRAYAGRKGPVDLPAALSQLAYVDAVAYRSGPDRVRVLRAGGEVEFRRVPRTGGTPVPQAPKSPRAREQITYHVIRGDDPLEWSGNVPAEVLAGAPLDERAWLLATSATAFPDLPAGLLSYFDGRLAADIVAFPAPQWDFDGWRQAGHGGIRDFEVYAPMMLAGPGVPRGRIAVARTVDLMPTLVELMGRTAPPDIDGESLLGQPVEPPPDLVGRAARTTAAAQ